MWFHSQYSARRCGTGLANVNPQWEPWEMSSSIIGQATQGRSSKHVATIIIEPVMENHGTFLQRPRQIRARDCIEAKYHMSFCVLFRTAWKDEMSTYVICGGAC